MNEVVMVVPPREVFLNPEGASWTWDEKGVTEGARVELVDGMQYYPTPDGIPYRGFPYAPAIADTAIFKRFLILRASSLKNPLNWISLPFFKREIYEMAYTCIRHDFLKPEYYCKSVREIYRVIDKFSNDFFAHSIVSVLQWDVAYRYRVQAAAGFINLENFRKNPILETWKVLGYAYRMDGNERVRKTWRVIQLAFILVSLVIPWKVRKILREVRVEELLMDKSDRYWAFPTERA